MKILRLQFLLVFKINLGYQTIEKYLLKMLMKIHYGLNFHRKLIFTNLINVQILSAYGQNDFELNYIKLYIKYFMIFFLNI